MITVTKFWMVYSEGASALTKQHWSLESAEAEARRISLNTRAKAHVLESVVWVGPKQELLRGEHTVFQTATATEVLGNG